MGVGLVKEHVVDNVLDTLYFMGSYCARDLIMHWFLLRIPQMAALTSELATMQQVRVE